VFNRIFLSLCFHSFRLPHLETSDSSPDSSPNSRAKVYIMKRILVILAFLLTTAFAQFTSWPPQINPLEEWEISYNGLKQEIVWFSLDQDGGTGIIKRYAPDAPRQRVTLKYDQKQDIAFVYIGDQDGQWVCAYQNSNKAPKVNGTLFYGVGGKDYQTVSSGCTVGLAFLAGGSQDLNWPPVMGELQLWKLEIGDEVNLVQATEKAQNSTMDGAFDGIAVSKTDPKTILGARLFRFDTGSEILFALRIMRPDGSLALCVFREARKLRNSIGGGDTLFGDLAIASNASAEFQNVTDKNKQCVASMVSF
jgi:hypothetical protein